MPSPQALLATFRSQLQSFAADSTPLRILRTVSRTLTPAHVPPKKIFVLDSSFNPPTKAHLRIAASALREHDHANSPRRLLLLLATQNADKAPKPAEFEQRLAMMVVLAEDLLEELKVGSGYTKDEGEELAVDIGVTKLPYFVGKAKAAAEHGIYRAAEGQNPVEQVHMVGFDTLIRIFDKKYYPPDHTLAPLQELFDHHSLRVTYRPDDAWGGKEEQNAYLEAIRIGEREQEGGKREWAERITFVEGKKDNEDAVSSTKIRNAAQTDDHMEIKSLCSAAVADWVISQGLYKES